MRSRTGPEKRTRPRRTSAPSRPPLSLNGNLRKVCKIALLRRHDGSEDQPSMQDFRPTFAVHRITSWIRNGADLNRLLPALAVYMGQVGLSSTQKYLCRSEVHTSELQSLRH